MNNKNNTKIMRYLDRGDVCGFVFVCGGGDSIRRVHLVDHLMEILPLLGHLLPACPHNIPLLLGLVTAIGGIRRLNRRKLPPPPPLPLCCCPAIAATTAVHTKMPPPPPHCYHLPPPPSCRCHPQAAGAAVSRQTSATATTLPPPQPSASSMPNCHLCHHAAATCHRSPAAAATARQAATAVTLSCCRHYCRHRATATLG